MDPSKLLIIAKETIKNKAKNGQAKKTDCRRRLQMAWRHYTYWKVTVSDVVAPSTRISTPGGKSVSVNSAMWSTTAAVLSDV